jgi:MtN3 and saliva related transmembrane protein
MLFVYRKAKYRTHDVNIMSMDPITILGLTAAAFTTVCLLPQLLKVYKTKSTKDISTFMFALYCCGVFLWLVYGLYLSNLPIVIANSLAFIQAAVILMLKLKYK